MKKYISGTVVSINVVLPNGSNCRVVFTPLTGSGSVFFTEDKELQKAIEKHYNYGVLFREDKHYVDPSKMVEEKVEATPIESSKKIVKVSDADAAKSYLAENFGISRTKMKTISQIQEAALSCGIEFEGI